MDSFLVSCVAKNLRVPHHFALPETPKSNGANERLDEGILWIVKLVHSELQKRPEWLAELLLIFQRAPNNTPSPTSSWWYVPYPSNDRFGWYTTMYDVL